MSIIPFGEYRPDCNDLNSTYTSQLTNVLPRGDGYGPFPSMLPYTAALPGPCRGAFYALTPTGGVALFAATATDLYMLNNTTLAWSCVSKGGTSYDALSAGALWQFVQYNNYVIVAQKNVAPQYFDLTASTAFADLPGSPPHAAYIWITNTFVVLGGIASFPFRIQWCGLGDPTEWTPGVNSSDYQDFADGGVVRGGVGGDISYIFQDMAIRNMVFAPGSDVVFAIAKVAEGVGLIAPHSLIADGAGIYFYSSKGFMSLVGGVPVPIGVERVDRTFNASWDAIALEFMIGASTPDANLILWSYKTSANNERSFDRLLAYNTALQRWAPITVSGQFLSKIAKPGITLEGLDAIASGGSLDALGNSLDSYTDATMPKIAAFNTANELCFFNGPALEAVLHTGEQSNVSKRMFVQGFYPHTDAPAIYGNIARRENMNAAPSYTAEQPMNARGFVPARADTRAARGRIRIPAGTAWTNAKGIEPLVTGRGAR